MKIKSTIALLFIFILLSSFNKKQASLTASPNVILIVTDDLGYGDLSCYGQIRFRTPNIDQLAKEGMLFTQHYAGAPVCAPSRCALLTGRHTGHASIRGNKKINKEGDYPLSEADITIQQLFQKEGYTTAMFGKWGLGYPGSSGDVIKKGTDVFSDITDTLLRTIIIRNISGTIMTGFSLRRINITAIRSMHQH